MLVVASTDLTNDWKFVLWMGVFLLPHDINAREAFPIEDCRGTKTKISPLSYLPDSKHHHSLSSEIQTISFFATLKYSPD